MLWNDASLEGDYTAMDYGNGTYRFTFSADIPGAQVDVRIQAIDVRGYSSRPRRPSQRDDDKLLKRDTQRYSVQE